MQTLKTKAIVLRKVAYREGDWIVTFLTEEGTRLSGFAPGARQSKKRFGGTLDLFNYVEIAYREGRGGAAQIESSELIVGMEGIRKSLLKFAVACYFVEIIIEFLQEQESTPKLFQSFMLFLEGMNQKEDLPTHVIPLMEHHFLEIFGFRPTLNKCLSCGNETTPDTSYFFSGVKGGILCEACLHQGVQNEPRRERQDQRINGSDKKKSYPLSYSVISRMLEKHTDLSSSWRESPWQPQEVIQARRALEYFIQYTAGKPFKSLQFLSEIMS